MDGVPATLVTGLPGAGKTALLRQWLAAKPAGERWGLLLNRADGGGFRARLPGGRGDPGLGAGAAADLGSAPDAVETVGGCACCAGKLAFETALVRLLRRGPWNRLLIELDGAGDPPRFVDLLRAGAAGRHLRLDEVVAVVDAETARAWFAAADADAKADAKADADSRADADVRGGAGSGGLRGRLLAAQIATADRVVLTGCGELSDPQDCRALAAALRARPPFRRRVELAHAGEMVSAPGDAAPDSPEDWPPLASSGNDWGECALAHAPGNGLRRVATPVQGGPGWIAWRWPAATVFDRAGLERLLTEWRALPGLLQAEGAFRTARDWYLWRRDANRDAWSPTGWRRDNRLELRLAADAGSFERLAAGLETGLLGAIRPRPSA